MKIAFYIGALALGKGGAERVSANLANWLVNRGHDAVVFYDYINKPPAYSFDSRVLLMPLNYRKNKDEQLPELGAVSCLCSLITSPDFKVPLLLSSHYQCPLIIAEHTIGCLIDKDLYKPTDRMDFHRAGDKIVLLCNSFLEYLASENRDKTCIIPNAISQIYPKVQKDGPRRKIIFIGRLVEEVKRLSLLIDAFARLAAKFPLWDLEILGDGEDRALYESQVSELKLQDRIHFRGTVENVHPCLEEADLFCLPSPAEGMSMAMLEAQGHNLPYIGFACCKGVEDVITDGVNGLLAPEFSSESLADALVKAMENDTLRESLSLGANNRAKEFSEDKIFGKWEALFQEMADRKGVNSINSILSGSDDILKERIIDIMRDYGEAKLRFDRAKLCSKFRKKVAYLASRKS